MAFKRSSARTDSVVSGGSGCNRRCRISRAGWRPGAACGLRGAQGEISGLEGQDAGQCDNPHTPGYEAIDPKDPSKYVGFDIDLGEEIGECLGFKLT
jgi:hypothetical protein